MKGGTIFFPIKSKEILVCALSIDSDIGGYSGFLSGHASSIYSADRIREFGINFKISPLPTDGAVIQDEEGLKSVAELLQLICIAQCV